MSLKDKSHVLSFLVIGNNVFAQFNLIYAFKIEKYSLFIEFTEL